LGIVVVAGVVGCAPEVVVDPPVISVPPVYTPVDGGHFGEPPSEGQPQPVYPPVSVPPVYVPDPVGTVGEAPSASQPQPVYPKPEAVVPVPVKPVVTKPQVRKPVKVVVRKKRKKYVSHRVTYPKQKRPDFYPEKYWKK
jgi:hypothetical protein